MEEGIEEREFPDPLQDARREGADDDLQRGASNEVPTVQVSLEDRKKWSLSKEEALIWLRWG